MKKPELLKALSSKVEGLTQAKADEVLKALAEVVGECLENEDEVTIPDLAKFSTKHKDARVGRNPSNGESVEIPAKTVPVTKAVKSLKDRVNK